MNIPKNLLTEKYIYRDCLCSECVLSETDTFEEFPLISRDSQLDEWMNSFRKDAVFEVQIGVAFFLLNFHSIVNRNSENDRIKNFLCITIQWDEYERYGFIPIPCIFSSTSVTEDLLVERFSRKKIEPSNELLLVVEKFRLAGLEGKFSFYESRFFDEASKSEIVRTYCFLRNH